MIQLTKIFHFEMAHAIHGYDGPCKNIHGHSYELHVTVSAREKINGYLPAPGFLIDFSDIKKLVNTYIIQSLDHRLLLSARFLVEHPGCKNAENLVLWQAEPTAENLLIYMAEIIGSHLPAELRLTHMKLYETQNSYAEWINDNIFKE